MPDFLFPSSAEATLELFAAFLALLDAALGPDFADSR